MPRLSVWLVRASLVHMAIGFLFGALLLHHKGIPIYPWTWRLLLPHMELMIFGWTIQFVMGTAFWILPRFPTDPRFGKSPLGWWSLGLLNAGIVLTSAGYWFGANELALIGRLSVVGAVMLFAIVIWPRVKPLGGDAASQRSSV